MLLLCTTCVDPWQSDTTDIRKGNVSILISSAECTGANSCQIAQHGSLGQNVAQIMSLMSRNLERVIVTEFNNEVVDC